MRGLGKSSSRSHRFKPVLRCQVERRHLRHRHRRRLSTPERSSDGTRDTGSNWLQVSNTLLFDWIQVRKGVGVPRSSLRAPRSWTHSPPVPNKRGKGVQERGAHSGLLWTPPSHLIQSSTHGPLSGLTCKNAEAYHWFRLEYSYTVSCSAECCSYDIDGEST